MAGYTLVVLVIAILLFFIIGYLFGKRLEKHRWEKEEIPLIKKETIQRSRATLSGQFSEQLAPYLPDFPFSPSEARFIGKPIDFIVFKGMDNKEINEVAFVEVKSGNSVLNPYEKRLRDVIQQGKVSWFEYRVPKDLTKKQPE